MENCTSFRDLYKVEDLNKLKWMYHKSSRVVDMCNKSIHELYNISVQEPSSMVLAEKRSLRDKKDIFMHDVYTIIYIYMIIVVLRPNCETRGHTQIH